MRNVTQITAPRVDFLDQDGKISREWYMYLYNLYAITGAGTGITPIINGGTGLNTLPTNGQLLIGNNGAYSLGTLGAGVGVSVTNGSGTIVLANTGVLSNIAGTGISVSSATGNVTIANTGVLSFSGGTTGLTPVAAAVGAVTLGGTLAIANGGTGTATPSLIAGTNITITGTWPNQTINSSGGSGSGTVTSVAALTLGTTGTDLSSTVANSTTTPVITLNVPTASATNRGVLSSADWTTFNNKGSGTITSVTGTSPVASSGGTTPAISLAAAYGDTLNPYASKTANYFLAAPNGSSGVPTFRAIVAADIPTLNQDTSGTAAKATNIAGGAANRIPYQTGANATSFISAPTVASTYLGWDGSAFTWGTVSATVNWAVPGALGSTTPNAVYVSSGSANAIPYFGGTGGKQILSSNLGYYAGNGHFLTIENPSTTSYSAATMSGVLLKSASAGGLDAFFGNSADTNDALLFGVNFYTDSTGPSYKYKAAGASALMAVSSNTFLFQTANTGVANADITWTNNIGLSPSGFTCYTAASFSSSVSATTSVSAGTSIKSTSTSAGVGYATGAGGAQTQSTSKSTGVTLNNICGQITMNAASLAATTSVSFTLTNSSIAATDVMIVNIASAATTNTYVVTVDTVASGSCRIHLRNISATSRSEALVLNFAVIKSVTA